MLVCMNSRIWRSWCIFCGLATSSSKSVPTSEATRVVRCQTVAFEPDPVTAAAFERNVDLNRITDLVEMQIAAVGERWGMVRFSTGLDTENHIVAATEPTGRDVPIQTLDQALLIPAAFRH